MNKHLYESLNERQLYIDKTECLEKGIVVFPSLYIEGAAASGKTTAVKMLCNNHPEAVPVVIDMGWDSDMEEPVSRLEAELEQISLRMEQENIWVIFENMNLFYSEKVCRMMKHFIRKMPKERRAILLGRERIPEAFLEMLWNREMERIPPEAFLFTYAETREYLIHNQSELKADEVYSMTEGWPGCVDMLVRMEGNNRTVRELLESYEISTYIENVILGGLPMDEKRMIRLGRICPWINPDLCRDLWMIKDGEEHLNRLTRKGIFRYNKAKHHYKLNRLFLPSSMEAPADYWIQLTEWYEKHGKIKEAFYCVKKTEDCNLCMNFVIRHYDTIPFLDEEYGRILTWKQDILELCYLRGMYDSSIQRYDKLKEEINRVLKKQTLSEDEEHKKREILLNLFYVNPECSFQEWMSILEKEAKTKEKYRLYGMLGTGYSFLCGIRDISGLFACSKKEEVRQAKIWKSALREKEGWAYDIARLEYYMETKRGDNLKEEDFAGVYYILERTEEQEMKEIPAHTEMWWRCRLAVLELMCRWPGFAAGEKSSEYIFRMEQQLMEEDAEQCIKNTEAVISQNALWWNEPERLTEWLRHREEEHHLQIDETNYMEMFGRAKGYLLFSQYEKAEKILNRLVPYLKNCHRNRYLAEALFHSAIIYHAKGNSGQSLRAAIESFLVTGGSRYVGFYTRYGKKGKEVLEQYVEWLKQTTPEPWHRKKKYKYGNVLHMPVEDYLDVILRGAKKETKNFADLSKGDSTERLTMMETIILQSIARGLNNAQICEEQNLKLPTVKTHIYSMYKKLGVNSRVQAVNKGKEMGIVR